MAERHLITVEEWERMVDAGVFDEELRLELLDGEILEMSPIGDPHAATVNRSNMRFTSLLSGRVIVAVQNPVVIGPRSKPQPDIALLLPRDDFYAKSAPRPDDIALLIEVTDTTHSRDRRKLLRYGQAGVRESWMADLRAGQIHVHRDPGPEGYATTLIVRRGERIALFAFPDIEVDAAEILP